MTRIALFCHNDINALVNAVNDFIKNKKVIDIQYQSMHAYTKFNGDAVPLASSIYDRVLIVYEEE